MGARVSVILDESILEGGESESERESENEREREIGQSGSWLFVTGRGAAWIE